MKRKTWRRIRNLTLFALGIVLITVVGFSLWLTHDRAMGLVHPGRNLHGHSPDRFGVTDWEDITFETEDGLTISGWFFPPAADSNGATVILVHGLGGNRDGMLTQAAVLSQYGYGALLYDMRNHGSSEGNITTFGHYEQLDVMAAFDWLRTRPEVNMERVALLGESMGGASVIHAAVNLPDVKAIIVQSAFSSIEDNVDEGVQRFTGLPSFPFGPLVIFFSEQETRVSMRDLRPVDDIARLAPRPVLIMHGRNDDMIDVENSYRLYEAANEPRELYIVEAGWHGGLLAADPEGVEEQLVTFLNAALRD